MMEVLKLTRFEHAVLLALAVLVAEIITLGTLPPLEYYIILSLLVPMFSEMGSFALNDYFDIETDKLNKKNRPLVKGTISPAFAFRFSILMLVLSTVLAYFINNIAFVIALFFNIAAVTYNWKLKDMPLVGNIYIALTMAIPFIFGNFVVSGDLSVVVLVLAVLGFVAGLAREIIKSVQDMKGDMKARKSKTLPIVIGERPSLLVAIGLYLLFIPLSILPFSFGLCASSISLVLIVAADGLIAVICYKILTKRAFKFARNMSLIAFLLGMLGLLLAAL
ncbi:UbiA family prenyltransferase [Candidatus Micrarchaeota archaeon]|nr:UbiA family prenyltransferase [Candidatus Micrarchaeota archaeon]